MSTKDFDGNSLVIVGVVVGVAVFSAMFLKKIFCSNKQKREKLLKDDKSKYKVKLVEREVVSHDTRRFRFALPNPEMILGLPIGQHLFFTTKVNGELVVRAYTPVSSDDDIGYVDLVIKVYFKNTHPKFPDGGKMSQFMEAMNIGDEIDIRGPNGLLVYEGFGKFAVKQDKKTPANIRSAKKVGLIAGGSGITPMLQIIRDVLKKADKDKTELWLLYANQTENDILLRKEIDDLVSKHPQQLHVWYSIDRKTLEDDWPFDIGFITADMVAAHIPPPGNDVLVLSCGPPPMMKFAVDPALDKLGYDQSQRFTY